MPKDRNDSGQLWENFLISERQKLLAYLRTHALPYFWRTNTGAELDYVEERDGSLFGYEMKFGKGKRRPPVSWTKNYDGASCELIGRENFLNFVTSI
jgi:predicted AAA+ superfamily ATPase